jgi:hypothetical protein
MPTLDDALHATLSAEAVEASFVHAVAGIRTTDNAYVSPRDGVTHSRTRFEMPDLDGADTGSRAETIVRHGALHTRAADSDEWVTLDMPRPVLGSLAFLTLLYGAEPERFTSTENATIEVGISASRAIERVPDELRSTLEDILAGPIREESGQFPEVSTARLSICDNPLHIAEMTVTTLRGGMTETFALEIHPVSRRVIDSAIAADDTSR